MEHKPLVSIIIITYNSSLYVLETLESAKAQTYNNIELIISDDCSTDDTYKICEKWLDNNKEYFKNVKLTRTDKNLGIAGNSNHGFCYCSGKWIKLIAGDDLLMPNCIHEYVSYIRNHQEQFIFSFPKILLKEGNKELIVQKEDSYRAKKDFFILEPKEQLNYMIIRELPMSASTFFCNSKLLKHLGGFDDGYLQEDRPLYMKITNNGYKLANLNEQLVIYRIHNSSISKKYKQNTPVNEFWFWNVHKAVLPYVDFSLLLTNPLLFVEYYNKFFVNYLTLKFGNTYSVFRFFRKFRWLSPLYFKEHYIEKSKI
jgi:glycosyltransferase involved in cell wall biosynthesis